jgi:hypothetical protein
MARVGAPRVEHAGQGFDSMSSLSGNIDGGVVELDVMTTFLSGWRHGLQNRKPVNFQNRQKSISKPVKLTKNYFATVNSFDFYQKPIGF